MAGVSVACDRCGRHRVLVEMRDEVRSGSVVVHLNFPRCMDCHIRQEVAVRFSGDEGELVQAERLGPSRRTPSV